MVHIRTPVLSLLVLLAVGLLATHASAARRPPRRCCTTYGDQIIPFTAIKGYSVQTKNELCNINAIIFHTKKGKEACVDPSQDWVMDIINRLRYKAQKMHVKTPGNKLIL